MRLVQALDRNRRVTVVPFQNTAVREQAGLRIGQCETSIWALTPSGRRFAAAQAANMVGTVIFRTWLPLLLYHFPLVGPLEEAAYHWIARNRSHLPGDRPYCEQHPEACR